MDAGCRRPGDGEAGAAGQAGPDGTGPSAEGLVMAAVIEVEELRKHYGSGPGLLTLAALAAILVVATAVAARTFRWE
jgi:hypothetical protein